MQPSYYNTTNQSGQALIDFSIKAAKQDDIILALFREYSEVGFTPYEVVHMLNRKGTAILITSVRRSMSTLTRKRGLLEKTKIKKDGDHKHPNYVWTLKK